MKRTYIEWMDACSYIDRVCLDEIANYKLCPSSTCGFILYETDTTITIGQTIFHYPDNDQVDGYTVIPKAWITKREDN